MGRPCWGSAAGHSRNLTTLPKGVVSGSSRRQREHVQHLTSARPSELYFLFSINARICLCLPRSKTLFLTVVLYPVSVLETVILFASLFRAVHTLLFDWIDSVKRTDENLNIKPKHTSQLRIGLLACGKNTSVQTYASKISDLCQHVHQACPRGRSCHPYTGQPIRPSPI